MGNIFLNPVNSLIKMHECGQEEYWFYHKGSFPTESPLLYQQLIEEAETEIIIWDPYFNVKFPNIDQTIFSNIQDEITIKILTCRGLDRVQSYLTDVEDALKIVIPPSKNVRFALRVVNSGNTNQSGLFFHDRFLITDEKNVFLVGSSVGYYLQSQQSTGMYKVSNIGTKEFIKSIFKYYWDSSTKYQIGLTYLHL